MAAAAPSIHSSPWFQGCKSKTEGPSNHQCSSRGAGRPKHTIPSKPTSRPIQPTGLIASPNKLRASRATSSGWESINTEPRPAPVWPRPLANRPWNRLPSTRAKATNQGQSAAATRRERFSTTAANTTNAPAGSNRKSASSKGLAPSSRGFIAAIAVPQRANGSSIATVRSKGHGGAWGIKKTRPPGPMVPSF